MPPDAPVEGTLTDGTRLVFRPIVPADKALLQRGMELLSPESRYRRFFSEIDHLSEDQLRYFTEIDYNNHYAWLATAPENPDTPAVGVARYIRLPDEPDTAEGAVTVIDSYQGLGVGTALLLLLAGSAIQRGVKRFVMFVLGENEPMMGLLHQAGAVSQGSEGGVVRMSVPLPATVEELEESAAPRIMRVAAEGKVEGRARPRGGTLLLISGHAAAAAAASTEVKP